MSANPHLAGAASVVEAMLYTEGIFWAKLLDPCVAYFYDHYMQMAADAQVRDVTHTNNLVLFQEELQYVTLWPNGKAQLEVDKFLERVPQFESCMKEILLLKMQILSLVTGSGSTGLDNATLDAGLTLGQQRSDRDSALTMDSLLPIIKQRLPIAIFSAVAERFFVNAAWFDTVSDDHTLAVNNYHRIKDTIKNVIMTETDKIAPVAKDAAGDGRRRSSAGRTSMLSSLGSGSSGSGSGRAASGSSGHRHHRSRRDEHEHSDASQSDDDRRQRTRHSGGGGSAGKGQSERSADRHRPKSDRYDRTRTVVSDDSDYSDHHHTSRQTDRESSGAAAHTSTVEDEDRDDYRDEPQRAIQPAPVAPVAVAQSQVPPQPSMARPPVMMNPNEIAYVAGPLPPTASGARGANTSGARRDEHGDLALNSWGSSLLTDPGKRGKRRTPAATARVTDDSF